MPFDQQDRVDFSVDHLCSEEKVHLSKLLTPRARLNFSAGRFLVRRLLASHLGIAENEVVIRQDVNGKPYVLNSPELHFNLSHTHGLVACAVSKVGPIGVDVENPQRETISELAWPRFFCSEELAWLGGLNGDEKRAAFLRLWTHKEAVMKADGRGMKIGIRNVKFEFRADGTIRLLNTKEIDADKWQLHSGTIHSYPWAVACLSSSGNHVDLEVKIVP